MTLERALQLCLQPIEQRRDHRVKVDRYALKHILKDREEKLIANAKEIGELKSQVTKLEGDVNTAITKYEQLIQKRDAEIATLKQSIADTPVVTEVGK